MKKRVLILVKTYPTKSKKYIETVCTAGIDIDSNEWLRLYPIDFRYLSDDKKFGKYDIIEVEARRNSRDKRPESFRIDSDSIRIIRKIGTEKNWEQRKLFVTPLKEPSMCEIQRKCDEKGTSLGMFKPKEIEEFYWEERGVNESKDDNAQIHLFFEVEKKLEIIPYVFRYKYRCNDKSCPGHDQCIIDWEIGQAFRGWRDHYGSEKEALQSIKNKWLNEMFGKDRDPYLIVGNQHRFKTFMVIGVFWPPKDENTFLQF